MRRPRQVRSRVVVVRTVVVVLSVWALFTIVPDLRRPFEPLATIGLTVDFRGGITSVEPNGPGAKAGIHAASRVAPGDRIDFGRTPSATLFALFGGLGGHPYFRLDDRVVVDLVAPDGAHRAVTLDPIRRHPTIAEHVALFVAELLGIAFIAVAAFLALELPDRRDVLGLFFYAIWFNPGENYIYYSLLPEALWFPQQVLSALLQALGLAGFVTFALRFPTDHSEGWRAPVERYLPLFVIVLAGLTIVGAGSEFGRPSPTIWRVVFWIKVATYPLIVLGFISKLHILPPVERLRLRSVMYGCIPGLLFYLLAESADVTSLWQPVFDRIHWSPSEAELDGAYLVNALIPLSIGYAVMRRRVLPLNVIVNRGLTLGVMGVVVAMLVEATVLTMHRLLEEDHVLSTLFLAAVLVTTAPLLEKLKGGFDDFIDRFLFVRLHAARHALDAAVAELAGATTTATIEAAIVERPCAAFELAAAALFRLEDDGTFRVTAEHGWPANAARTLSQDDALVRQLRDSVRETASIGSVRERIDADAGPEQPEIILTLAPNAAVEALVFYGGHTDGSALTRDEMAVLTRFVRRCGAVRAHLQAVTMRQEIAQLRDEVKRLQAGRAVPAPASIAPGNR